MLRIALTDLWSHKRRLVSTWLAVFLGVSFLAGALTLGDTLRANFVTLFADVNAGTDVVVRSPLDLAGEAEEASGAIDAGVVDQVQAVDGIAVAEGAVDGYGQLVGADGSPLGGGGPPTLAGSWISDEALTPWRLAEGRPPAAPGEVVINRGAATDGGLAVGDRTVVLTPAPVDVTVVGIATFGDEDGLGPTTQVFFSSEEATRLLLGRPDIVTRVVARGDGSASPDELVARVERAVAADVEVVSGSALADEAVADIDEDFLGFLRTFLVVFAVIALVVATFSIHNTFSILAAQRTRAAALLRALGATRRQVLGAMLVEAVVVGVVASATGLLGGLAAAAALKAVFDAAGFALPAGGLTVSTGSLALAAVTGLVVTVVAGASPAVRSSRVPPLAALRDVAVERAGGSRVRVLAGVALAAIAVALLATGTVAATGTGALLLTVAAVVLGPGIARPVAGAIGRPVAAARGLTGELARENAVRSPRRTASTASALMIGVGVVVLFTVLASSIKASVEDNVTRSFAGDLVLSTDRFDGGVSPALAGDSAAVDGVRAAVGLGSGRVLFAGERQDVTVADPAGVGEVLDLGAVDGVVEPGAVAISAGLADDHDLAVGSEVPVTFADGAVEHLRVSAVYERADLVRSVLVPRDVWDRHASQSLDLLVLVALDEGADAVEVEAALASVAGPHGVDEVLDARGYAEQTASGVDMALGLIYVLLALAIVIALLGISNTLSLAVHERTRELGLLRAVGATRRQVRSMVRWESVVVALLGTASGLVLGVVLARALVAAIPFGSGDMTFAVPGSLAVVVAAGALAGVLAAVRPARRAARLDVLDALATA